MRHQMASKSTKAKTTNEKDVDMRTLLPLPHRTASDGLDRSKYRKMETDSLSKNTQLEKANEQINAATRESYRSQYMKDANVHEDDAYGKH